MYNLQKLFIGVFVVIVLICTVYFLWNQMVREIYVNEPERISNEAISSYIPLKVVNGFTSVVSGVIEMVSDDVLTIRNVMVSDYDFGVSDKEVLLVKILPETLIKKYVQKKENNNIKIDGYDLRTRVLEKVNFNILRVGDQIDVQYDDTKKTEGILYAKEIKIFKEALLDPPNIPLVQEE